MLSWLFPPALLTVGSPAPDFTAVDEEGRPVSSAALRGKNVVLVFYPGDDTSVCTRQLCELRDRWPDVTTRNIVVFGVNPAGPASHRQFRGKYNLPFPILVDQDRQLAKQFHANGLVVRRTVYVIGPDGLVRYAQRGKPPVSEILAAAA